MKKIMCSFACILSIIALTSCASAPIAPIEDRSVRKVHEIDLTKNEIYDMSLEWMAQTSSNLGEGIEIKDREKGKIIGKGIASFIGKVTWGRDIIFYSFTMILEAKDNTYRTTYTNFIRLLGKNYNRTKPLEEKYVDAVKAKSAIIDDDLYGYLKKYKSNTKW